MLDLKNLSPLQIGITVIVGIVFVGLIGGLIYISLKKDPPKPLVNNVVPTSTPSGVTGVTTLSPDEVKAKNLEPIFIKGAYTHLGTPFILNLNNFDSTPSRDTFINNIINNKEGCFSFPNFEGKPVFITEVLLPSDIRAKAWGQQVDQAGPCKFIMKKDIEPLVKTEFSADTVYGLKFTRV
jgi:hypothetical protein